MSAVHVSESVAAPAEQVWELLGDFGGVMKWGGPMIETCHLEGSGVGAVRRIGLRGGLQVAERCEAIDSAGRSISYSIIEGAALFSIKDYFSTCTVVDTGADECRVEWKGTFVPDGVTQEQAHNTVRKIYTSAIVSVRKALLGS